MPNALELGIKIFFADDAIGILNAPYVLDSGELTGYNYQESCYIKFTDVLCERSLRRIKNCFVMIRREIIGDIRWRAPYLHFIFYRRIAKNTKIYFLPEVLGKYHMLNDPEAETQRRRKPNIKLSIDRAEELAVFIDEFKEDFIKNCPSCISNYAYGSSVGLLLANKKRKAINHAFLSFKYKFNFKNFYFYFIILPFSPAMLRGLFNLKRLLLKK